VPIKLTNYLSEYHCENQFSGESLKPFQVSFDMKEQTFNDGWPKSHTLGQNLTIISDIVTVFDEMTSLILLEYCIKFNI
jgi:hypothetical protein